MPTSKRWSVSSTGWVLLGVVVLALLALFLGSRGMQFAGLAVIALVVMLVAIDHISIATGRAGRLSTRAAVEPDYIPEAGTPSDEDWSKEQELYRRKPHDDGKS